VAFLMAYVANHDFPSSSFFAPLTVLS
jgi:hypothetical protein